MAFFNNFCPIKSDLSGNTVWQQASVFQNLAKIDHFGTFNELLSTQNVSFEFLILAFSANFCPNNNDLSGNTV